MNPQELRIGNWVKHEDHGNIEVFSITIDEVNFKYYVRGSEIEPIPLSEEWTFKINLNMPIFIKLAENAFKSIDFNMGITLPGGNVEWLTLRQVEFVHEVQNLYFALTGEELELKQ